MPDKDPLDMSEVLAFVGEPLPDNGENFTEVETDEERIKRLEEAVAQAEHAAFLHYEALTLLVSICKERGFDPFPGESMPLQKPINAMTPQEIILRNEEAHLRAMNIGRASSKDKIKAPTQDQLDEMYAPKQMNPALALLVGSLEKGENVVTYEQISQYVKATKET